MNGQVCAPISRLLHLFRQERVLPDLGHLGYSSNPRLSNSQPADPHSGNGHTPPQQPCAKGVFALALRAPSNTPLAIQANLGKTKHQSFAAGFTRFPKAVHTMQTDFVLDALEQALYARRPHREGSLVHHSDRGSQYVSIRYSERLAEAGIEPSVGSTGDSYDNALAETINGLYKAELIHRRGPWKTREAVELATLEWVSWFNNHRLLEPIGYIPPAEAEANYWRQHAQASSTTKLAAEAAPQEG